MALGVLTGGRTKRGRGRALLPFAWLGLALGSASCVPSFGAESPRLEAAAPPAPLLATAGSPGVALAFGDPAVAANAALPIFDGLNPAAAAFLFRGSTPLDRLRALDCLAQAVYYEAASESEDGQRAVAQVVLNRVRHPAWPNSVCGVVYQGPMAPGGGCQFTFTCDGSLARRAEGLAWAHARRIAAEALSGRTYVEVGLSTHYHTHEVFPAWAPRLHKIAVIGAHNFYRLPGEWGGPAAFAAGYSGREPFPRPAFTMRPRPAALTTRIAGFVQPAPTPAELRAAARAPSDIPQDPRWTANDLPESTVREEYRNSGRWRADAPAAITGR